MLKWHDALILNDRFYRAGKNYLNRRQSLSRIYLLLRAEQFDSEEFEQLTAEHYDYGDGNH
jgi:hypothetical protein